VIIILAGTGGYLDDLEVPECRRFEKELYAFLDTNYGALLQSLAQKKALDDQLRAEIKKALEEFKERFIAGRAGAAAAD
jgi:F-type H+-transporting ATPase subunit alpha